MEKKPESGNERMRIRRIREESKFVYADVSVEMKIKDGDQELDEKLLKLIINSALKSVHGDKGSASNVDILKFDSSTSGMSKCHSSIHQPSKIVGRAYLRIPANYFVIVRSSLTLLTDHKDIKEISFKFNKICHSLSSLPLESKNCTYNVVHIR